MLFNSCTSLDSASFLPSQLETLKNGAFQNCTSLRSIALPDSLAIIEKSTFFDCKFLATVVFNSNLTTIDTEAISNCAITNISLPEKLMNLKENCFANNFLLKCVVCNKNLKTIDDGAFARCTMLEDFQLASSSISFSVSAFSGCDRLIELAAAAGFPSNDFAQNQKTGKIYNAGRGVAPYLIHQFERSERKRFVLLALMRFKNAVHAYDGTEEEKVAAAKLYHPRPKSMPHPTCFTCKAKRRGH